MNKVKPTERQKKAFVNIQRGMNLRDAMLEAGYTKQTSHSAKQKLVDSRGFTELIKEYREDLRRAGITKEVLAEVQAEGLFDQDAKVRLDYLKETKKDLGLTELEKGVGNTTNILVIPSELMGKYGITSDAKARSTE